MRPTPRSRSATWLVALALLGAPTSEAHAQAVSADTLGAVDGTVVDSAGRGIGGVEVSVMDTRHSVRTTAAGGYRIEGVPIGPHMLRFRRLGLNAVVLGVTLRPDEVTGVDVVMARSTYQLATVEVRAAGGSVWALPRTFVQRMQTGMGTYVTEADVVARHALKTEELFRTVPGVRVLDGKVYSDRGINSLHADPCPSGMPLYVNGAQAGGGDTPSAGVTAPGSGAPAPSASSGLDTVDPRDIVGIEVYRGPAGLPAGIPPSACGAIIVWTK